MKKRMEITVEIDRMMLVSSQKSPTLWCELCAAHVRMLTVDEAAALTGASSRNVYRRVESGELHFAETPEGRLFICPDSLSRQSQ
jgi:excisionase family DNA binding protein